MKLRVTYDDGEPTEIIRPPTLTDEVVGFRMDGSTAVWTGEPAKDLPEVVEQVEALPFVQATEVEE
jgi:hypothetical protein